MESLVMPQVNAAFWKGKKVFLTGHTGFKGSWLSIWLQEMGAVVCGYALPPATTPNLFSLAQVAAGMQSHFGDLRNQGLLQETLLAFDPDIIFHLAAQPLVRQSYLQPLETYEVNVLGTAYLLEAARALKNLKLIINVTTDKCYENQEWCWGYRETEALGGYDPYSSSKACSELVTSAYRQSFFEAKNIGIATARAGNVIGGGDWTDDRLIPDLIRAFSKHEAAKIRYPKAIRPWQHVLEPLSGYIMLAEKLYSEPQKYAGAWNFGPYEHDAKPVEWIVAQMVSLWGSDAQWQLDNDPQFHEAHYLKLDCSKASTLLQWSPKWSLHQALSKIVAWYQAYFNSETNIRAITLQQIKEYIAG